MSRYTKRAYLRLCPEKRRKKELVLKGLKALFGAAGLVQ